MDWFRAYHGLCTDPKLHRIARSIHVSRGLVVAGWVAVLETASANGERGNVGEIDAVSLAFMIDVKPHVGAKILGAFRDAGMIDSAGAVAAWTKRQRQSDDASVRKRKFRERETEAKPLKKRQTAPARHGTIPSVEQNRTEQIETPNGVSNEAPIGASDSLDFEDAFRQFYGAYPRKVGPQKAAEKYRAALKRASHEEIMDGLRRAILAWERNGTAREYIPHPATWLNGGRWADEHFDAQPANGHIKRDTFFDALRDLMQDENDATDDGGPVLEGARHGQSDPVAGGGPLLDPVGGRSAPVAGGLHGRVAALPGPGGDGWLCPVGSAEGDVAGTGRVGRLH